MKILRRADFLKLPEGTIFAKGKPWYFENLSIKADSLFLEGGGNDFLCLSLPWVEASDSGQAMSRLDEMLETGVSYPMEDSYGRDGCFDDEEVFLVLEEDDLLQLRGYIDTALQQQKETA